MSPQTSVASHWLVACDLDQTLIYSRRAFRLAPGSRQQAEPALRVVEHLDGEPLSYLTQAAALGLRRLAAEASVAAVVPVTTRTLAQYRRIELGFTPAYAIAANGGHLLVDGIEDAAWEQAVRARLAASGQPIQAIRKLADEMAAAAEREGRPWVRTIRDADGFFVYLVAHDRAAIPDLRGLETELAGSGWGLSVQGRKVYLVPLALTKEAAIGEVMSRSGARRLAAAGDSLLDLGMLRAADVAVRPRHGELHDQAITFDHLLVSGRDGILGGEEIIEILRRVVAESGDSGDPNMTFRVSSG